MGRITEALSTLFPSEKRPLASMPRPLNEGVPPGSDGSRTGQRWLVPADVEVGQILDYVAGTGEDWPFDLYQPEIRVSRDTAITYSTLYRCVTLISGALANLVTKGDLHVVDKMGKEKTSRRIDKAIELMTWSPDGGVTPASNWIEDAGADYCLDGNALVVPVITMDGMPQRLRRFSPWDNDVERSKKGQAVYRLAPVDSGNYKQEYHAERDVIHCRWPRLQRWGRTRNRREGFALSPVIAMRPALDIGMHGDRYIRNWYNRGSKSQLHVNFETKDGQKPPNPVQRLRLVHGVHQAVASEKPLVTFNANSSYLQDLPQDRAAKDLRDFQVIDVARAFGIPPPVIGHMTTEWGEGIAELARYWWKFGLQDHLMRFLDPFSIRLLPPGHWFAVDPTNLLRGDADAISKLLMATQGDAQRPPVATWQERRKIAGFRYLEKMPEDEWTPAPVVDPLGGGGDTDTEAENARPGYPNALFR